ncbi:MAG: DUF92 domain-containing protein [Euryarchaeota archaeon]|nr:DUF92 domain-containing protein [Euryarchaeota archaeon]
MNALLRLLRDVRPLSLGASAGVLVGVHLLLGFPLFQVAPAVACGACTRLLGRGPRRMVLYLAVGGTSSFLLDIASRLLLGAPVLSEMALLTTVSGLLTAGAIHSIQGDYGPLPPAVGAGMAMWLVRLFRYLVPFELTLGALAFALAAAWVAYRKGLLEESGLFTGALLGVLLIVFTDVRPFLLLLTFFALGAGSTRFKFEVKRGLGAEQKTRDYRNVLGNGLGPLGFAVASRIYDPLFIVGFLGAVGTATADTMATEVGETQKKHPRLITTLERVKPGTSGAVSALGEMAALLGAATIALLALLLELFGRGAGLPSLLGVLPGAPALAAALLGAFTGTQVDSLLGATLEGRLRIFNNHTTNFFATLCGGLFSLGVAHLLAP